MCKLEAQQHICRVKLPPLPLCFAVIAPCAQTVEACPRVPGTVVTFRHLFAKVNNAYVRFIAQSLPPFAATNDFS